MVWFCCIQKRIVISDAINTHSKSFVHRITLRFLLFPRSWSPCTKSQHVNEKTPKEKSTRAFCKYLPFFALTSEHKHTNLNSLIERKDVCCNKNNSEIHFNLSCSIGFNYRCCFLPRWNSTRKTGFLLSLSSFGSSKGSQGKCSEYLIAKTSIFV